MSGNFNINQINVNITDVIPPDNFATITKNGKQGNTYSIEEDNAWRAEVEAVTQSGIKGVLKPNTPYDPVTNPYPTPWVAGDSPLYEKYDVNEAGSFPNTKDVADENIIVTQTDLDLNEVQIWIKNGVAEKVLKAMPQASVNVRKWEDLQSNDFPLNEGSQVVTDDGLYIVPKDKTATESDVPGASANYKSLGGNNAFEEIPFSQSVKLDNLKTISKTTLAGNINYTYNDVGAVSNAIRVDEILTNGHTISFSDKFTVNTQSDIDYSKPISVLFQKPLTPNLKIFVIVLNISEVDNTIPLKRYKVKGPAGDVINTWFEWFEFPDREPIPTDSVINIGNFFYNGNEYFTGSISPVGAGAPARWAHFGIFMTNWAPNTVYAMDGVDVVGMRLKTGSIKPTTNIPANTSDYTLVEI